jgi:hypothetical protein
MNSRRFTIACTLIFLGVFAAISFGVNPQATDRHPALPPFEFHLEGATNHEDAAKAMFRSVAMRSIKDFVQHLALGTCDGPVGTIQKFAECLHTTMFDSGEGANAEAYTVYNLLAAKDGGLKNDTIRVVASGEFPTNEKVASVIRDGSVSSYYGEKFLAVDVAADGFDGREYRSRVVVAVIKNRWYAVPRCRSSKAFYDIADAMLVTKPAAEQAK